MIITVRAVLVALFVDGHVLPERLLAFLAHECHFHGLSELVCLVLGMAFCAVVPLLTAWRTNRNLCVENVLAVKLQDQIQMQRALLFSLTTSSRQEGGKHRYRWNSEGCKGW